MDGNAQRAMDREYALAHGHAPMARNVACLDFDGTLYPFVDVWEEPKPNPGAAQAARRLRKAGFRIVIFTSRLSPTWLDHSGEDYDEQYAYIVKLLERDGIPFDDVTAEKVPAAFYVDDKAIRYSDNWREIADLILFSRDSG